MNARQADDVSVQLGDDEAIGAARREPSYPFPHCFGRGRRPELLMEMRQRRRIPWMRVSNDEAHQWRA